MAGTVAGAAECREPRRDGRGLVRLRRCRRRRVGVAPRKTARVGPWPCSPGGFCVPRSRRPVPTSRSSPRSISRRTPCVPRARASTRPGGCQRCVRCRTVGDVATAYAVAYPRDPPCASHAPKEIGRLHNAEILELAFDHPQTLARMDSQNRQIVTATDQRLGEAACPEVRAAFARLIVDNDQDAQVNIRGNNPCTADEPTKADLDRNTVPPSLDRVAGIRLWAVASQPHSRCDTRCTEETEHAQSQAHGGVERLVNRFLRSQASLCIVFEVKLVDDVKTM